MIVYFIIIIWLRVSFHIWSLWIPYLKLLLDLFVKKCKWNPRMTTYISSKHKGIYILNLIRTARSTNAWTPKIAATLIKVALHWTYYSYHVWKSLPEPQNTTNPNYKLSTCMVIIKCSTTNPTTTKADNNITGGSSHVRAMTNFNFIYCKM